MNKHLIPTNLALIALLAFIFPGFVFPSVAQDAAKSNKLSNEQGITNETITLGGLVTSTGALSSTGLAVKSMTEAFFMELNSRGGINGRKVEIKFVETGNGPNKRIGAQGAYLATVDLTKKSIAPISGWNAIN